MKIESKSGQITLFLNIPALHQEISLSNIKSHVKSKKSVKAATLCFGLILVSLGPSGFDIGTDIWQSQNFLEGDTYVKMVTSPNHSSVTDYDCTLQGVKKMTPPT